MDRELTFTEELLADIELTGIKESRALRNWYYYKYNDVGVPRVSEILSSCIGDGNSLTKFIANMGSKYFKFMDMIFNTGTMAHTMIEDYLTTGSIKDTSVYLQDELMSNANPTQALNCFHNFQSWLHYMNSQGFIVNVIEIEKSMSCPWYGGTCDLIAEIIYPDGRRANYILDFKSSKEINFRYFLQTMLYLKLYNYNKFCGDPAYQLNIDGIGIIRLDKNKDIFEYIVLDKYFNKDYLDNLDQATNSMIDWFYYQISTSYCFNQYKDSNLIKGEHYGNGNES